MSITADLRNALWGDNTLSVRDSRVRNEEALLSGGDFEFYVPPHRVKHTGAISSYGSLWGYDEDARWVRVDFTPHLLQLPLTIPDDTRRVRVVRKDGVVSIQAYHHDLSLKTTWLGYADDRSPDTGSYGVHGVVFASEGGRYVEGTSDDSYIGDRFGYCVDRFADAPGDLAQMRATRLDGNGPVMLDGQSYEEIWTDSAVRTNRSATGLIFNRNMLYSLKRTDRFDRRVFWNREVYMNYSFTEAWQPCLKNDEGKFMDMLQSCGADYFDAHDEDPDPSYFKIAYPPDK